MGVYIKGMEMPTSCFQCEFRTKIDPDNLMCIISQKTFEERFCHIEGRDKSCPLVPVPPHGNLIERDALTISTAVPLDGKPYQYVHIDNIKGAPTIIPADPPDKEGET